MSDVFPTNDPGLQLLRVGVTDLGCRREKNEDSMGCFSSPEPGGTCLVIVADGVGGGAAGEVASQLAVETVGREFFAAGEPADAAYALDQAMKAANRTIYQQGVAEPLQSGMATTCTCAAIKGETILIGHVGDCRAYMAVDGELMQLTVDHSLANDYAREGRQIPPEEEGLANVLTRWLGFEGEVVVDLSELMQFKAPNTLIMCSDGLTKVVQPDEILHAVSMHLPEPAANRMVSLARERGGPDNITVQIARLVRK